MPASSFSSVLLPAPFWPMMPSTSPGSTVKVTSSSALNGVRCSSRLAEEAAHLVQRGCLQALQLPELEFLGDVVDVDDGHVRGVIRCESQITSAK